jgi:hypothetical protein
VAFPPAKYYSMFSKEVLRELGLHRRNGGSSSAWLVAEQRVPVLPQPTAQQRDAFAEGARTQPPSAAVDLAQRLQNSHGICDLSQAFLSSPRGRRFLPAEQPSPEFASGGAEGLSDAEFELLILSLDPSQFEEVLVAAALTHQTDAGGLNLLVRLRGEAFEVVMIDTTDSLPVSLCGSEMVG